MYCYHANYDGIFDGINYTVKYAMTKLSNKLTAKTVKNLKHDASGSNKHADGGGLYLFTHANGSKYWRMDYRRPITQKRNTLSFGTYPQTSLEEARIKRDEVKKSLSNGIDPAESRNTDKEKKKAALDNTFGKYAQEWLALRAIEGRKDRENLRMIDVDILPYIGAIPVTAITTEQLERDVTNRIISRGAFIIANRARNVMTLILNIPLKKRLIQYNPATSITVPKRQTVNHPAVTDEREIAILLKKMWTYTEGSKHRRPITELAMKLSVYLFQRPHEIRDLLWENVDFERRYLTYVSSKTQQDHIVPLSNQAFLIIQQIKAMDLKSIYVFPSRGNNSKCISQNSIGNALEVLGYKGQHTAHGFRATARTLLDEELDTRTDFIEHQLAHKVKDPNGTAYNRTKHLRRRRKMMQLWADYLDALRLDQDVSRFKTDDDDMDDLNQFSSW